LDALPGSARPVSKPSCRQASYICCALGPTAMASAKAFLAMIAVLVATLCGAASAAEEALVDLEQVLGTDDGCQSGDKEECALSALQRRAVQDRGNWSWCAAEGERCNWWRHCCGDNQRCSHRPGAGIWGWFCVEKQPQCVKGRGVCGRVGETSRSCCDDMMLCDQVSGSSEMRCQPPQPEHTPTNGHSCDVPQCGCTPACIKKNNGGCTQGCGSYRSCHDPGCACASACYPPAGPGCPQGCGTSAISGVNTCEVPQCGCSSACLAMNPGHCTQGCGSSRSCHDPGCACASACYPPAGPGCPQGCGTQKISWAP
jgi:hypothetical protein